ncbi:MAG: hypothetical protein WCQ96_01060 [Patescibacteria group bacterium]
MKTIAEQTYELMSDIIRDKDIRTKVATESHYWFFHIYFHHYVKYPTADFQRELFAITQSDNISTAVIVSFRGSAKSTIMTMSYPIWSILGKQQKKFVIIISQTQYQARMHLSNLKRELESNRLLRSELGPFEEKNEEWGSTSLVIPKFNARITAASCEQSVRGLRHGANRPDLIVCDDVEDLNSVKTREGRDKTYNWLTGEVIPSGDRSTKVVVVGNLLHEDSLLMRLKANIEENKLNGIFRAYPLTDHRDQTNWPGKFPTKELIDLEKMKVGNEISWQREYLLRIVPNIGQVVHREWIHYYDVLPQSSEHYTSTVSGVDLAISKKDTADCTAIVSAKVYSIDDSFKLYILPNPINEKMEFPDMIRKIKALETVLGYSMIYVEDVAFQASLYQQLIEKGIPAEGVKIHGQDKLSRLTLTTALIQSGKIIFPRKGTERLIEQMLNFGIDKHDDLVDAFTLLVLKVANNNYSMPRVVLL